MSKSLQSEDTPEPEPWTTCVAESNRPITLTLHAGEPVVPADDTANVQFGAAITDLVLLADTAPVGSAAHEEASRAASNTQGAEDDTSSAAEGSEGSARQAVSHLYLRTLAGCAKLQTLQLGEIVGGVPTLAAGLYTLVFSSHGLPAAYASVSVAVPKGKK